MEGANAAEGSVNVGGGAVEVWSSDSVVLESDKEDGSVSLQSGTIDLGSTALRKAVEAIELKSDTADGGVVVLAQNSVNVEGGGGQDLVGVPVSVGSVGVDVRTEGASGVAVSTGDVESGSGRVVMTTGASAAGASGGRGGTLDPVTVPGPQAWPSTAGGRARARAASCRWEGPLRAKAQEATSRLMVASVGNG